MSEDDFGTLYRFIPSVRRGFRPEEPFAEDGPSASAQPAFGVSITSRAKSKKGSDQQGSEDWSDEKNTTVHLDLYGPGDIEALDHSQIARVEPDPGTQQFQPNYFPFVSFDAPGLPWQFSPERADRAGRTRPWMTLITVEKQDGVSIEPPGQKPVPALRFEEDVDLSTELPPLSESWAWAHAQLHGAPRGKAQGDWLEWGPRELQEVSNITASRLLSPRNLTPGTDYYACLVPTFEPGRLAGLGEDPYERGDDGSDGIDLAWTLDDPPSLPFELPVYYYWEFGTTDREVTFEKYVEDLRTVTLGEDVGTKEIDVSDPGPDTLVPQADGDERPPSESSPPSADPTRIAFDGALISLKRQQDRIRNSYALSTRLRELLNKPETLRDTTDGPTLPIVGPPLYGQWHAGLEGIPVEPVTPSTVATGDPDRYSYDPTWFRELNQNVRTRAAAARGAKVVKRNQGALMNAAWDVAGEIREANRAIRYTQIAGVVGTKIENRGAIRVPELVLTPGQYTHSVRRTIEQLRRMATRAGTPMPWEDGAVGEGGDGVTGGEGGPPIGGGARFLLSPGSSYLNTNRGGDVTSGTPIDPIRTVTQPTGTTVDSPTGETVELPADPMVETTGVETPNLLDSDGGPMPDGGAAAENGNGNGNGDRQLSAAMYGQLLQDLDARPETSLQFQRLARLDGPIASRTGTTAADYERVLGRVIGETLQEVERLADMVTGRATTGALGKGAEYWQPPASIGRAGGAERAGGGEIEDDSDGAGTEGGDDESDVGSEDGTSGDRQPDTGTSDIHGVSGFLPPDATGDAPLSDRMTAPGFGATGRTAPMPTISAAREYRETEAALDARLPDAERLEPEPESEADGSDESASEDEGSEASGESRGSDEPGEANDDEAGSETSSDRAGAEAILDRLETIDSHAAAVVEAMTTDGRDDEIDLEDVRTAADEASLVLDSLAPLDRLVSSALADEAVELPESADEERVTSTLASLRSAVDALVATLPTETDDSPESSPDPSAVDALAATTAAAAVSEQVRELQAVLAPAGGTVPMTLTIDSVNASSSIPDPLVTPRLRLDRAALGDVLENTGQAPYFRGRLGRRVSVPDPRDVGREGKFLKPSDPVEQVMLAPEFPTPMWRPLKELATEYLLPGAGNVPEKSIGLVTQNREFIESYMVGLNHEFARELLWRGYPTDRGGSYFKRFWNKGRGPAWELGMGVDVRNDAPRDIEPIHDWNEAHLGDNAPYGRTTEGTKAVLLVRSRLFKLFPHVNVYAGKAYLEEEDGTTRIVPTTPEDLHTDPANSDAVQFPSYRGKVTEDITFLGFDLTVSDVASDRSAVDRRIEEVREEDDRDPIDALGRESVGTLLGYYFVFEERPGEIRFGFDQGDSERAGDRPVGIATGDDVTTVVPDWAKTDTENGTNVLDETVDLTGWADFSWHHLAGPDRNPDDISYVNVTGSPPDEGDWAFPSQSTIKDSSLSDDQVSRFERTFDDPLNAHDRAEWGKNSAHMARISWQKPVRMSRHANRMLPEGLRTEGGSSG
jgi:hypothetical protein